MPRLRPLRSHAKNAREWSCGVIAVAIMRRGLRYMFDQAGFSRSWLGVHVSSAFSGVMCTQYRSGGERSHAFQDVGDC